MLIDICIISSKELMLVPFVGIVFVIFLLSAAALPATTVVVAKHKSGSMFLNFYFMNSKYAI